MLLFPSIDVASDVADILDDSAIWFHVAQHGLRLPFSHIYMPTTSRTGHVDPPLFTPFCQSSRGAVHARYPAERRQACYVRQSGSSTSCRPPLFWLTAVQPSRKLLSWSSSLTLIWRCWSQVQRTIELTSCSATGVRSAVLCQLQVSVICGRFGYFQVVRTINGADACVVSSRCRLRWQDCPNNLQHCM